MYVSINIIFIAILSATEGRTICNVHIIDDLELSLDQSVL